MKSILILGLMIFSAVALAETVMQIGPKVDFNQLDKSVTATRGEKPVQGRGPASVEPEVKKESVSKKGLHIKQETNTYRDALIQPKY